MQAEEYRRHDGLGLAELVRRGDVQPSELLAAAQAAVAARNKELNAVVRPMWDEASAAVAAGVPDGPFAGVPFLLKDLGQKYRGVVTAGGCRLFQDDVADHDSTLVARYKAAGLVICGKTNTPELGLATTTEPLLYGPCRNPWNPAHSPGGSSGGAAAAVAAGFVPLAHASDGGGSIRIPASCCGLVGLKPTRGRIPLGPDGVEGWGGLSTAHAVTRTVRDSAALLDCSAGPEPGSPYHAPAPERPFLQEVGRPPGPLRVALCLEPFTGAKVDAAVRTVTEQAAAALEDLGHHVEPGRPNVSAEALNGAHGLLAVSHSAATLQARAAELGRALAREDVEAVTWRNYQTAQQLSAARYAAAVATIRALGLEVARFFERYDLLLTPTLGCLPPKLGEVDMMSDDDAGYLAWIYRMIAFTSLFNDTGNPAVSLPLGTSAGLPVGVQLVAPFGAEGLLLRVAAQIEAAGLFAPDGPSRG